MPGAPATRAGWTRSRPGEPLPIRPGKPTGQPAICLARPVTTCGLRFHGASRLRSVQLEPDLRSPGQGRRGEGRLLAAAVAQPGAEPLHHLGRDLLSGTVRAVARMSSVRM